jgi:hypothetical protein
MYDYIRMCYNFNNLAITFIFGLYCTFGKSDAPLFKLLSLLRAAVSVLSIFSFTPVPREVCCLVPWRVGLPCILEH